MLTFLLVFVFVLALVKTLKHKTIKTLNSCFIR
nr:MAG TPA: hypothetical protein [Caudoviricetes sp.]